MLLLFIPSQHRHCDRDEFAREFATSLSQACDKIATRLRQDCDKIATRLPNEPIKTPNSIIVTSYILFSDRFGVATPFSINVIDHGTHALVSHSDAVDGVWIASSGHQFLWKRYGLQRYDFPDNADDLALIGAL